MRSLSIKLVVLDQEEFSPPANRWHCLESPVDIQEVEVRDALKHPTVNRDNPTTKDDLAPHVNAKVEKPGVEGAP